METTLINIAPIILTSILVIVTTFYAYTSYGILKENRNIIREMEAQRELASRPYIVVHPSISESDPRIYLNIVNRGKSAARALRLTIDRSVPAYSDKDRKLSDYAAFRQVIESFPPMHEIQFYLADGLRVFAENADGEAPFVFTVRAEYEAAGRYYDEQHVVDIRPYENTVLKSHPGLHVLERIEKALRRP